MTNNTDLAEELHRAGEDLDIDRDKISSLYDRIDGNSSDGDFEEYLAEDLHRKGEEMGLERQKIADVYNWLKGGEAEELARENTEEYLKEVDDAYDRLEEQSNVDGYSTGLAWDAAGEAFSALEE